MTPYIVFFKLPQPTAGQAARGAAGQAAGGPSRRRSCGFFVAAVIATCALLPEPVRAQTAAAEPAVSAPVSAPTEAAPQAAASAPAASTQATPPGAQSIEFSAVNLARAFDYLDADHNGRISREEAAAIRGVARNFDRADLDKNNALSREEFVNAMNRSQSR